MSYRAVIFDLYDTLLFARDTNTRAEAYALVRAAGIAEEDWAREWKATSDLSCRGRLPFLCQRVAMVFQAAGLSNPSPDLLDRVTGLLYTRQTPRLFPDVREALAEVRRRGYRLGMISNLPMDEGNWVRAFDLEAAFDAAVMSYEVGWLKPEREIFLLAAERLGVAPGECVFVDDLAHYLEGARAVGMTPVQINRHGYGRGKAACPESTQKVADLAEFLSWLQEQAG
jgi:epoxide hydrolase-like predicted phosphatase